MIDVYLEAEPGRFGVLQHIGTSMPAKVECETHRGLACAGREKFFARHD